MEISFSFQCPCCFSDINGIDDYLQHQIDHNKGKSEKCFLCPKCDYSAPLLTRLKNHLMTHVGKKPFACPACEKTFPDKGSMNRHMLRKHNIHLEKEKQVPKGPLSFQSQCRKCQTQFIDINSFLTHLKIHKSPKEPYQCPKCKYSTIFISNLRRHLWQHASVRPHKCSICEKSYFELESLKVHMSKAHSIPIVRRKYFSSQKHPFQAKCHKCPTQCSDVDSFLDHVKSHRHGESDKEPFTCPLCMYSYNSSHNLRRHMLYHNQIKPHKCFLCEESFIEKNYLKLHMSNVHMIPVELQIEKPQATIPLLADCPECLSHFTDIDSFLDHLKSHRATESVKQPNRCPKCSYTSGSLSNLRRHLQRHSEIKPHKCFFCEDSFVEKISLKRHMSAVHKIPVEPEKKRIPEGQILLLQTDCPKCSSHFTDVDSFLDHLKSHRALESVKEPYSCPLCPYTSSKISNFRRHLTCHVNLKPFECKVCKKGFVDENALAIHLKEHGVLML